MKFFWLYLFIGLQIADGVLTYNGISQFGLHAEGNDLLVTWSHLVGVIPTLIGAKTLASFCGTVLFVCGKQRILAALSVMYLLLAVVPWVSILVQA